MLFRCVVVVLPNKAVVFGVKHRFTSRAGGSACWLLKQLTCFDPRCLIVLYLHEFVDNEPSSHPPPLIFPHPIAPPVPVPVPSLD